MSQKKVDSYKAGKAGRSKASRKEKMIDKLEILAWIAICVAMVGWIGFSAYAKIETKQESVVTETVMDTSAIEVHISGFCHIYDKTLHGIVPVSSNCLLL